MAKRNMSFIDEHIEKVAIGGCALVLLGAVWYSFLSKPFVIGQDLTPTRLVEELRREAEATAQSVRAARPKTDNPTVPTVDPAAEMRMWFGDDAPGLIPEAGIAQSTPRTQPFPPRLVSATETSDANRHILARFVAPGIPVVTSGRTTFFFKPDKPDLGSYDDQDQRPDGEQRQHDWVSVAVQVDLFEQSINFQAAKYPPNAFPDIVAVHLQRYDEDEPWRGWQDVDAYRPYKPFNRPVADPSGANMSEMFAFSQMIAKGQQPIARPLLPARASGGRIQHPPLPYYPDPPNQAKDIGQLATSWYRTAREAESAKGGDRDLDAAFILARAVVGASGARDKDVQDARSLLEKMKRDLKKDARLAPWVDKPARSPELLMPIVAHDLTATPGHTYRYRMRYEVYNLFAGNPGELINRADAGKLTVFSDWSPSTRPVTIESDLRFFLTEATKADQRKGQATVTVHKRLRSGWKKADFTIKVGDVIGEKKTKGKDQGDYTTSAVCVEIDFNRRNGRSRDVVLVYVDTDTGRLGELSLDAGKAESEKLARAE